MQQPIDPMPQEPTNHTNASLPCIFGIGTPEMLALSKAKKTINQALQDFKTQQIVKLLEKVGKHGTMKEVLDELTFTEWLLQQKQHRRCDCCDCSCQACIAMDKGDDMVFFYLKDCPYAYAKAEGRLAWEWICYSIALPCLCLLIIPILAYAGSCYCRGCLPNVLVCHSLDAQVAQEQATMRINNQILKKIKKLISQCKSYA